MWINPKFLKHKSKKAEGLRTVAIPRRLLKLFKAKGINVSEVCRTALDEALKEASQSKGEALSQVSFRYDSSKSKALRTFRIDSTKTINEFMKKLAKRWNTGTSGTSKK